MGCAFAAAAPASHATHYRINALVKHSEIAEGEVAGAIGLTGAHRRKPGHHLLGRAEVLLEHDPGLPPTRADSARLVGLAVLLLADDERHI